MPASIVIMLRAIKGGSLLNSNGLLLHAIWYKTWAEGDENMQQLAAKMHEIDDAHKPFTISPLMNLQADPEGICYSKVGQVCWFRITSLSDELTNNLSLWVNKVKKSCIEMKETIWYIEKVYEFSDEHNWAGQISYAGLERLTQKSKRNSVWTLELATPTTLNGTKFVFPFPQPDSLVRSWARRWKTFAPENSFKIHEDLFEDVRGNLSIESYQLATETVRMRGAPFPGCIGRITFKDQGLPPESRQTLNLLMHFAFFCGSGYKTTQGLGQTRLIRGS